MADTTFVDGVTVTSADWFNDVNDRTYVDGAIVQAIEGTPYTTYNNTTTAIPNDDTIPQDTEGLKVVDVTIVPTSATNRLVIEGEAPISGDTSRTLIVALFSNQDATADAIAVATQTSAGAGFVHTVSIRHEMPAGTTSPIVFSMHVGVTTGGTCYINGNNTNRTFGGKLACRLRVTEVYEKP